MLVTYRANTGDGGDTILVSSLQQLEALHTSANLEDRTRVCRALIVLDILNLLQAVCPDAQGALGDRSTIVIVSSITNDQTQVQRTRKVDGQLDLRDILDLHGVLRIPALSASTIGSVARGWDWACHAIVQRVHQSAIIFVAALIRSSPSNSLHGGRTRSPLYRTSLQGTHIFRRHSCCTPNWGSRASRWARLAQVHLRTAGQRFARQLCWDTAHHQASSCSVECCELGGLLWSSCRRTRKVQRIRLPPYCFEARQ